MTRLSDTSPEAEQVLANVHRRLSAGEKWLLLSKLWQTGRALHAAGARLRNPTITPAEIQAVWMKLVLGFTPPEPPREGLDMTQEFPDLKTLREVVAVFDRLGIPYALGGSMASSIHGVHRATHDADVTAEPFAGKESALVASFGADYYISLPAVEQAVRSRSSFNVINTRTGFKVDVFVRKDDPFEQSAMSRRRAVSLPDAAEQPIVVHTPEDLILFKLRWYRLGNETSEQQWRDVLGVLQTQAGRLDQDYLDQWAGQIGVADLLARARQEGGPVV